MTLQEKLKRGFIPKGEPICLNLMFMVAKQDFDIHLEGTKLRVDVPGGPWDEFGYHLCAAGLVDVYGYVETGSDPIVLLQHVEGRELVGDGNPMKLKDCDHITLCTQDEDHRTFYVDSYTATRGAMELLEEVWPGAFKHHHAQRCSLIAAAISELDVNKDILDKIEEVKRTGDEKLIQDIGKVAESRHAIRRMKDSVAQYGFSVSGMTSDDEGGENLLYTTGLCTDYSLEYYIKAPLPVDMMAPIISLVGRLKANGHSNWYIEDQLNQDPHAKQYKPRLLQAKTVTIDDIFVYRISDTFMPVRIGITIPKVLRK